MENKFFMMVGLDGSGRSKAAHNLTLLNDGIIISSDIEKIYTLPDYLFALKEGIKISDSLKIHDEKKKHH